MRTADKPGRGRFIGEEESESLKGLSDFEELKRFFEDLGKVIADEDTPFTETEADTLKAKVRKLEARAPENKRSRNRLNEATTGCRCRRY